jgi:hypothetical protein
MKHLSSILFTIIIIFFCIPSGINAQERSFTEGSVWEISYVKTKLPYFNDYMTNLNNGWKKVMDEAKKEGLILNYMVLSSAPANQEDWNLMLMIEYKNMAAMDGLEDKMEKISEKLFGNEDQRQQNAVSRNELREILGNKTARQLTFKQ